MWLYLTSSLIFYSSFVLYVEVLQLNHNYSMLNEFYFPLRSLFNMLVNAKVENQNPRYLLILTNIRLDEIISDRYFSTDIYKRIHTLPLKLVKDLV